MIDISVNYLGLKLKSPFIAASSGYTADLEKIVALARSGAGAIVLKSLFEESITREVAAHGSTLEEHPEAYDYISSYLSDKVVSDYLNLIRAAVIAITDIRQCIPKSTWNIRIRSVITYARKHKSCNGLSLHLL